ncbi:hypothetical protein INR49_014192 [Caranx melampygus]|nr:hypothetical protein INR49_014192 [Caranx melampygus]
MMNPLVIIKRFTFILTYLGNTIQGDTQREFGSKNTKNEDEDGAAGGRTKPTLVSIPNPLYSGSRAFAEPFGDTSQGMEPSEPEEPPKILDLDQ